MTKLETIYTLLVGLVLALVALKNTREESSFPRALETLASLTALASLGVLVSTDSLSVSVYCWLLLGLSSSFIGKPAAQWAPPLNGGLVFSAMALWVYTIFISGAFKTRSWSSLASVSKEAMEMDYYFYPAASSLMALFALFAAGDLFARPNRQKATFLEAIVYWTVLPLGLAVVFQLARPLHLAGSRESILACLGALLLLAFGSYQLGRTRSPSVFVRLSCGVSLLSFIAIAPLVDRGWLLPLAGFLAAANGAMLSNAQADRSMVSNSVSAAALTLGPVLALILSPKALASLQGFSGAFPLLCAVFAFFSFVVLRFTLSLSNEEARVPKVEWLIAAVSLLLGMRQAGPLDLTQPAFMGHFWLVGSWVFAASLAGFLSRNPRYQLNIDDRLPRLTESRPRNREFKWLETTWRVPFHLAGSLGALFALWNVGSIQYGLVVFFCGVLLFFWAALNTQVLW